jgi:hypothetical protein
MSFTVKCRGDLDRASNSLRRLWNCPSDTLLAPLPIFMSRPVRRATNGHRVRVGEVTLRRTGSRIPPRGGENKALRCYAYVKEVAERLG